MKLVYTVHRCTPHTHPADVTLGDGSKRTAFVPVHVVELTPVDAHSETGVIKLALHDKPTWQEGQRVEISIQEVV